VSDKNRIPDQPDDKDVEAHQRRPTVTEEPNDPDENRTKDDKDEQDEVEAHQRRSV